MGPVGVGGGVVVMMGTEGEGAGKEGGEDGDEDKHSVAEEPSRKTKTKSMPRTIRKDNTTISLGHFGGGYCNSSSSF